MIERGHPQVSLSRQCELLKLSRSSVYYVPREQCQEDLDLMYLIDQQHLETPYYGSRKMRVHLERKGHLINRKRCSDRSQNGKFSPRPFSWARSMILAAIATSSMARPTDLKRVTSSGTARPVWRPVTTPLNSRISRQSVIPS
mgnify:CR=1 FL=1